MRIDSWGYTVMEYITHEYFLEGIEKQYSTHMCERQGQITWYMSGLVITKVIHPTMGILTWVYKSLHIGSVTHPINMGISYHGIHLLGDNKTYEG